MRKQDIVVMGDVCLIIIGKQIQIKSKFSGREQPGNFFEGFYQIIDRIDYQE